MQYHVARSIRRWMTAAAMLMTGASLPAQEYGARVAGSLIGSTGQRQTRSEMLPNQPATRISNRVQLRLRNRLDRFYSPTANAASPFQIASDQVRAGRR